MGREVLVIGKRNHLVTRLTDEEVLHYAENLECGFPRGRLRRRGCSFVPFPIGLKKPPAVWYEGETDEVIFGPEPRDVPKRDSLGVYPTFALRGIVFMPGSWGVDDRGTSLSDCSSLGIGDPRAKIEDKFDRYESRIETGTLRLLYW